MSRAAIAKPVVMTAAMAAATQEGRKTTFREVVRPQPWCADVHMVPSEAHAGVWFAKDLLPFPGTALPADATAAWQCPIGERGDWLYVQEPWNKHGGAVTYLADGDWIADLATAPVRVPGPSPEWQDADTMALEHARLFLEIVSVRAHQLKFITPEQAIAEGVSFNKDGGAYFITEDDQYKGKSTPNPKEAFYMLWESMGTGYMWAANPWVWAVEFKVVR